MKAKISAQFVKKCLKKRNPNSVKGQNGRVIIVGGSDDLAGAPSLASMAAKAVLRGGADLVTVIAPEKCGFAINCHSPDIIVKKVQGKFFSEKHASKVLNECKKAHCVLIGPGLGQKKETAEFVKKIVKKIKQPMVIDADAIKALKGKVLPHNSIITPHLKEAEIFCSKKINFRAKAAQEIARKYKCIVLLKGPIDFISDGKKTFYNKTGNAGMTIGGTGDVLAGLCASLVAQGTEPFKASCAAAFINGLAGDQLLKKKGIGFSASDLAEQLPFAMKRLR